MRQLLPGDSGAPLRYVDLMGGQLSVSSIVDQGTTFRFQIPVGLTTADAVETLDLQLQHRVIGIEQSQTAPDGGPFRLLIVEDNRDLAENLSEVFAQAGYEVVWASSGSQALAEAAEA